MSEYQMKGFTLIELLLVIVIVGMMISVVATNIGTGNEGTVLNGASREITSAIRYARGHAMTHRKEAAFQFDLEQNSYQVTDKNKVFKLDKDIDVTLDVAQSQIEESQGAIRFFPDGSSTGGRVTLEMSENKRQLDVNWLTGQVEISEN